MNFHRRQVPVLRQRIDLREFPCGHITAGLGSSLARKPHQKKQALLRDQALLRGVS